jgi:hypothetical protein
MNELSEFELQDEMISKLPGSELFSIPLELFREWNFARASVALVSLRKLRFHLFVTRGRRRLASLLARDES